MIGQRLGQQHADLKIIRVVGEFVLKVYTVASSGRRIMGKNSVRFNIC